MPKIKREENEITKKVEGYIDPKRNVFVVTGDPHGLLSNSPEEKPLEEKEIDYKNIGEMLKKYKPDFLKEKPI